MPRLLRTARILFVNEPQNPRDRTAERRCSGRKLRAGFRAAWHGGGTVRFRASANASQSLYGQSHSAPCLEVIAVECRKSRGQGSSAARASRANLRGQVFVLSP